jgi:dihydrofolate reductase
MTNPPVHIEAYAIVSADGMLADANGVIPPGLRIAADQRFFQNGLQGVDLVVHGRNSQEVLPDSANRRRIILTGHVPAVAKDPSNSRAILWNPAGASFDQALAAIGSPHESVAVIGGPTVFEQFLDLYDVFYLSQANEVSIPGGRAIFREVPSRAPEAVLAARGLDNPRNEVLDSADGLTITAWQRPAVLTA